VFLKLNIERETLLVQVLKLKHARGDMVMGREIVKIFLARQNEVYQLLRGGRKSIALWYKV
jgi:hypothetical protein